MAQTTVAINLEAKTKGTESIKGLKSQLQAATKEADALAAQFGVASEQAIAAAQKVADLKEQVGDVQKNVQALGLNKFQTFATMAQGVANGIQAAQGAMALFGAESEDAQKALVKVQGAMAFAQGINSLMEMQKGFGAIANTVKTKVITAFSTLRGAFMATGIGALAVGVGLLLTNFEKVSEWIMKSPFGFLAKGIGQAITAITDFLGITSQAERDLEKMEKATTKSNQELGRQIEVLTALGGKEKEVYELKKRQAENELNILRQTLKTKGKLTDEEWAKFNDLKNKQKVLTIEYNNFEKQQADKKKKEDDAEAERKRLQAIADNKERVSNERKALQDLAEERRKQLELNAKDERALADIKYNNDLERLKVAKENDLRQEKLTEAARKAIKDRYDVLAVNAKTEHDKKIKELDKKAQDERLKQQEDFENKRKELTDKEISDTVSATDQFYKEEQLKLTQRNADADEFAALELQRLEAQLQNAKDYGQSTVDLELQIAQKKKEIYDKDAADKKAAEEAKIEYQNQMLQATYDSLAALQGILKEGSDAAKAAALLDIAIKTGVGFAQGLDIAQKGAAGTGPAAPYAFPIFYAQQIAAVLGAVSRAKAILKGGSGGGGSTGGGGVSVPSAPALAPTAGGTLPDEQQFGGMGRVYVLEGDITKTQTRVRRLRNTSVV